MAFEIVNRQPTFLTVELVSSQITIGPKATKGPFADQELSTDIKLKESRGILSLRHRKEEIPQEEISKLVEEAKDLQKEEETNTSNKPKLRRRKRRNG